MPRKTEPTRTVPLSDIHGNLPAVLAVAESCLYERQHTNQVAKLALEIFDGLKALHRMGQQERFLLYCGALLHDIGWLEGRKGHHKTAMKRIMAEPRLPFESRERQIVALIARYHRKALPQAADKYFGGLEEVDQCRVEVLAGILRVADGLDRSHDNVVRAVRCRVSARCIEIGYQAEGRAEIAIAAAEKKADLLERVFGRRLVFKRLEA